MRSIRNKIFGKGFPSGFKMKINCPNCGHIIPSEDIDLSTKLAKCEMCHNVFDFTGFLGGESGDSAKSGPRMAIGLPDRFTLEREATGGLLITRRWFSPVFIFLAFFTVFWNGFMVVWFTIAISQGETLMALFGSIHGAVGIGLVYFTLAGFVNRTEIRVDYRALTVRHRPLPVFSNRDIPASDLKQLYSKERIRTRSKGGNHHSFEVHALTHSGRNIRLLSGLPNSEQALFVEQELEKYLRIEDRPVKGEIGR